MIRVEFLGPIQKDTLRLEINNLKELATVLQKIPGLEEWLASSAVAVNDTLVSSLDYPLKDGDKVCILPPVCGG
ncbi:MAG: molybdopterin synthase sulfur carrier subunit [Sulfurimonas sp.]|nr:MAG: molybdopterin synthase sulfur carrier subunit [Sulfurimonas sp.]